jgi:ComF family protein
MLGTIQNSLLSLIFPQSCQICSGIVESAVDGVACNACWGSTRMFDRSEMLCAKCGAYFGEKAAPVAVFCHQCDDHHYDKAIALGVYEKALAAVIVNLKRTPVLPGRLSKYIRPAAFASELPIVDVVVPVPLSVQRRKERGFNQAEIIAAAIGRTLSIDVDANSLKRTTHTPLHRGGMDQKARDLSVRKAFDVVRPKLIAGKRLLLVDDVLTSGSTVSYCSRALKKHGASAVTVFTLARAVKNIL